MNSFNRKIAEKFGPQRAKPKKFGCLGNFLHGALRPCIFIARHPANCLSLRQRRNATNRVLEEEARSDRTRRVSAYIRLTPASVARISYASCHPEHSEGSKTFLHKDISLTLNMTFRLCRHSKLQPPEPPRTPRESCITDKNHSPDYVLAAFFLSLVAFLSFWSQQKERNEQNSFLRNGIFRLRSI